MAKNNGYDYNNTYSGLLALTVTLKPQMYELTPQRQHKQALPELLTLLNDHSVKVHMLVAELTSSYNVHYHATVQVFQTRRRRGKEILYNIFRRRTTFGYICVKDIEDEPGWITYMQKDLEKTNEVLRNTEIVFTSESKSISKLISDYKESDRFDSSAECSSSFEQKEENTLAEVESVKTPHLHTPNFDD